MMRMISRRTLNTLHRAVAAFESGEEPQLSERDEKWLGRGWRELLEAWKAFDVGAESFFAVGLYSLSLGMRMGRDRLLLYVTCIRHARSDLMPGSSPVAAWRECVAQMSCRPVLLDLVLVAELRHMERLAQEKMQPLAIRTPESVLERGIRRGVHARLLRNNAMRDKVA